MVTGASDGPRLSSAPLMARRRKILSVVGTRPNFMKTAPVVAALASASGDEFEHVLVHTGQHYDDAMSRVFFEELGVGEPDHMLDVGSGSHAQQTARVMERLEPVLLESSPTSCSSPATSTRRWRRRSWPPSSQIPVGHVEAGLRSFDRTMPEEINRSSPTRCPTCCSSTRPRRATTSLRRGRAPEGDPLRRQHDDRHAGGMLPRIRELRRARRARPERAATTCSSRCTGRRSSTARCWPTRSPSSRALPRELPVVFPVPPAHARRARRARHRRAPRRAAAARPARLPGLPGAGGRRGRRAHRLGRHPGGDDVPRRAVLHAARQHRAPGHGRDRHQHAARPRPGADRRGPGAAGRRAPSRVGAAVGRPGGSRIADVLAGVELPERPSRGGRDRREPPRVAARSRRARRVRALRRDRSGHVAVKDPVERGVDRRLVVEASAQSARAEAAQQRLGRTAVGQAQHRPAEREVLVDLARDRRAVAGAAPLRHEGDVRGRDSRDRVVPPDGGIRSTSTAVAAISRGSPARRSRAARAGTRPAAAQRAQQRRQRAVRGQRAGVQDRQRASRRGVVAASREQLALEAVRDLVDAGRGVRDGGPQVVRRLGRADDDRRRAGEDLALERGQQRPVAVERRVAGPEVAQLDHQRRVTGRAAARAASSATIGGPVARTAS